MPTQTLFRRCAAVVWSLTSVAAACAGSAQVVLENELTGGSSRAWVLHEIVRTPIAGTACLSGAIYTFTVSHDLQVTQCQAGHLATSHHTWTVHDDLEGATTLIVTGIGTYAVTLQDARPGPGPRRLRIQARDTGPGWPADENLHANEN